MADTKTFGASLQDVLTRGLDAAAAYYTTRLNVNDPTPSVTGPNGQRVAVGQSALLAAGPGGVPVWAWVAGGVAVAAVLVLALRR